MRERSECATVRQSKRELHTTQRVCVCVYLCVCECLSVCCVTEHARETSYCDPRSSNDRDCECERVCEVRREREEREAQARRRKRRRDRPFIRLFMGNRFIGYKTVKSVENFYFFHLYPHPRHLTTLTPLSFPFSLSLSSVSLTLFHFALSFFKYSFFFIISLCLRISQASYSVLPML